MVGRDFGHEGQISLLSPPVETPTEEPGAKPLAAEDGQLEMPVDVPGNYPSLGLATYYRSLAKTLDFFSKINVGENFRARFRGAAGGSGEDKAILDRRINPRYGNQALANKKFDESVKTSEKLEGLAREKFAKAFGREVIIASGIKTEQAVDVSMDRYYTEFQKLYGGLGNKHRKNSFAAKMKRRADRFERLAKK